MSYGFRSSFISFISAIIFSSLLTPSKDIEIKADELTKCVRVSSKVTSETCSRCFILAAIFSARSYVMLEIITSADAYVINSSSIIVRPCRVSVSSGRNAVISSLTFTFDIDIAQKTAAARNRPIMRKRYLTIAEAKVCIKSCFGFFSFFAINNTSIK